MIPKIAHFHWDGSGPPMSWLRLVSISTFAKFNPTWEIRLIRSAPQVEGRGLSYGQKADLSWWLALEEHGGFQVATDIVFFKPVPDDWLDADLCANTNGSGVVYQFAMLGAKPQHPLMCAAVREGLKRLEANRVSDYQDLGVWLLKDLGHEMGECKELPMSALCYYNSFSVDPLWSTLATIHFPDDAIGAHWYGGHTTSQEFERDTTALSQYPIAKLAASVFP